MKVKNRFNDEIIGEFDISPNANLRGANLRGANLRGANLRGANLRGANLCDANLCDANLCDANLYDANLCDANLYDANLCGADLRGADLRGADLCGANLCGAKNIPKIVNSQTTILPDGDIIGWKKTKEGIIKLLIPSDAKRSNATGRKCRAEYAIDLTHYDFYGNEVTDDFTSKWNDEYIYKVGEKLIPDSFDENRWKECSNGIHFFITKEEAEQY